jgi:hypothetical protein
MSRPDPNEGHAERCACLHPGDRECNCHKAYGYETAEEMGEDDERRAHSGPAAFGAVLLAMATCVLWSIR